MDVAMDVAMDLTFNKFELEYLKFDKVTEKLNSDRQLCALLYLQSLGIKNPIGGADHDTIWLDHPETLTDEQVLYLTRCGVYWDNCCDSLALHA